MKNYKYVLDFIIFIGRINYKYYMEDLLMSKYYSINKFSKILGVSAQTLRNWDKKGKLHPHHTSSNGYRYYSHEQLNQVMNVKPNLDRIVIGYCRVSSNKQKDDLERQIENMKLYLTAQGKRANKARKLVKELIDDGGEEDDKNNSSHADPK